MGVRAAIWKHKLWAEPDFRLVSSGIPDYLTAVANARFCLMTEGNSWGTRIFDYMAIECLPLIVNDRMLFTFENILPYASFSLHASKRQVPQLPALLRNVSLSMQARMHASLRVYKPAFIWWRPEGLAYEYTLAALGERVGSLKL